MPNYPQLTSHFHGPKFLFHVLGISIQLKVSVLHTLSRKVSSFLWRPSLNQPKPFMKTNSTIRGIVIPMSKLKFILIGAALIFAISNSFAQSTCYCESEIMYEKPVPEWICEFISDTFCEMENRDQSQIQEIVESLLKADTKPESVQELAIDFSLYPNPSSESINIKCCSDKQLPVNVEFLDLNGKQVGKREFMVFPKGTAVTEMTLSHLANGVYFLMIHSGEMKFSRPFIKG